MAGPVTVAEPRGDDADTDADTDTGAPVGRSARLRAQLSDPVTIAALLVVVAAVVMGIWLRYRYSTWVEPGPDSDEAEFGLLAQQLLRGELPLLMRGQPYGGTPWLAGIAASLRVFGMNELGLRLPTVVLGVTNALLALAIGRQLGWSLRRALLGAGGVWCYPMAAVFFASRETMYFVPAVTASLVTLSVVLRAERHRSPTTPMGADAAARRLLVLAGFAAGVGFWINPGSLYITGPTFVWLGLRALREAWASDDTPRRRVLDVLRPAATLVLGVLVGAFPWWFLTVFGVARRDNYGERGGYSLVERAEFFAFEQVPGWLGFKVPIGGYTNGAWLGGTLWRVAFVAFALLLVVQALRRRNLPNEGVLTAIALGFPIVFLFVTARSGPVYANLRYVFFAAPLLGLLVVAKWRRDAAAVAAAALLPLISFAGLMAWHPPEGRTTEAAVALLRERGATCVIGDYWAAGHRLMFESQGDIVAVSTFENRNPLYVDQAEERGNCPWIFYADDPYNQVLVDYLADRDIDVEVARPGGGLVVYFPERRVWVTDVFPDALTPTDRAPD